LLLWLTWCAYDLINPSLGSEYETGYLIADPRFLLGYEMTLGQNPCRLGSMLYAKSKNIGRIPLQNGLQNLLLKVRACVFGSTASTLGMAWLDIGHQVVAFRTLISIRHILFYTYAQLIFKLITFLVI